MKKLILINEYASTKIKFLVIINTSVESGFLLEIVRKSATILNEYSAKYVYNLHNNSECASEENIYFDFVLHINNCIAVDERRSNCSRRK